MEEKVTRRGSAEIYNTQRLCFLGKVLGCILLALLFLVAVFDPEFSRVWACLGVIVCCCVAAIIVDRRFRRGKYETSDMS